MTAAKKTATKGVAAINAPECNVPDCWREPTTRGLCDAHYATHRGLGNPKEDS